MQNSNFLYLGLGFHFRSLRKQLRKATVSFVMSVCLPVFLHGTSRIPPTFLKLLSYVNAFYCILSTYFNFV